MRELQKQKINILFRTNEQGFTYGATFIDNHNKTIFNGSDLGKAYSAKAIMERFGTVDKQISLKKQHLQPKWQLQNNPKQLQPINNSLSITLNKYQAQSAPSVTHKKKKRKGLDQDQGLTL